LGCNLFVAVDQGCVVLERGAQRVPVESGSAAFAVPSDLRVSEVPDLAGRHSSTWIFFNDRAISRCLRPRPRVESLVAIARQDYQFIIPFERFTRMRPWFSPRDPNWSFLNLFHRMLGEMIPAAYMFLRGGYFTRLDGLNRWLEESVLWDQADDQKANSYPAGRRGLLTAAKTYLQRSHVSWWRQRKSELASVWLRHGTQPIEVISKALGYDSLTTFSQAYLDEVGLLPTAEKRLYDAATLSKSALRQVLQPFWYLDPVAERQRMGLADIAEDQPDDDSVPTNLDAFWSMRSTGTSEFMAWQDSVLEPVFHHTVDRF
jgi:AraC-like DNA-binding protein